MNKVGQKVKHWTTNQGTLLDNVDKGGFSLRSKKFEKDPNQLNRIFSGNEVIIEKMVKTYGEGAIDVMEVIK
jgi:hypothetical protein